jgi:hypothetical protein
MNNTYVCNKANNGYQVGDFVVTNKINNILSRETGLRIKSDDYKLFNMVNQGTITLPITEYEQTLKDAERYRWLRIGDNPQMELIMESYGDELDEAIDQAMKAK